MRIPTNYKDPSTCERDWKDGRMKWIQKFWVYGGQIHSRVYLRSPC